LASAPATATGDGERAKDQTDTRQQGDKDNGTQGHMTAKGKSFSGTSTSPKSPKIRLGPAGTREKRIRRRESGGRPRRNNINDNNNNNNNSDSNNNNDNNDNDGLSSANMPQNPSSEEGGVSEDKNKKFPAAREGMLGFRDEIRDGLKKLSRDDILLKFLHRLLFGSVGQRKLRKHNIKAFSFFNPKDEAAKNVLYESLQASKWTSEILKQLALLFGVSTRGTKVDLANRCASYLVGREVKMPSAHDPHTRDKAEKKKKRKKERVKKVTKYERFLALSEPKSWRYYRPHISKLSDEQLQEIIRKFLNSAPEATTSALRRVIMDSGKDVPVPEDLENADMGVWISTSSDGVSFAPESGDPQQGPP